MNKITSVHLNGKAFQVEEGAHALLQAYLGDAGSHLGDNPDKAEIIADLEQAIGDKCLSYLNPHKDVVTEDEMKKIISEMGPVEGSDASNGASGTKAETKSIPKKFYLIREGAMIAGVCTGLAAYFNIDVMLVRGIFIFLTLVTGGAWVFVYLALMFFVPYASTSEQISAATGAPFNAREVIQRAKENVHQFADRAEWKSWRRERRHQSRAARRMIRDDIRANHSPFFGVASIVIALVWIFVLLTLLRVGGALFSGTFLPLWIGIIIFILLIRAIVCSFRGSRCGWHGSYGRYDRHGSNGQYDRTTYVYARSAWVGFVDVLVLIFLAYAGWFLYTHFPDVHSFVDGIVTQVRGQIK